jgi:DMSO reductase family type II enzyme chaperone
MPTPSEPPRQSEFGVGSSPPRRSVFGNYRPELLGVPPSVGETMDGSKRSESAKSLSENSDLGSTGYQPVPSGDSPDGMESAFAANPDARFPSATSLIPVGESPTGAGESPAPPIFRTGSNAVPAEAGASNTLQSSFDTAFARTFLYRLLAKAYEAPERDGWEWLSSQPTKSALWSAVQSLAPILPAALTGAAAELANRLTLDAFDEFHFSYITCFGHTVRGDCPMNEIEYGDIKADPLFQPHRLADLGAFYAAFGLEMAPDAAERQDYISIELEFMSVLAAKEAYALEHQLDDEEAALCREAQKKFLREHLGRWTPAFTRRLARLAGDTTLSALAGFTREFITVDCAHFKIVPGSEDLLLRPIDEASESLCASCGITSLPPGALAGGATT